MFINNPAGTNYNGVVISDVASLNISTAKLHITGAGRRDFWFRHRRDPVKDNSTIDAGSASLVISNSFGQGIVVTDNSHANLTGVSITGGAHGGLVVVNQSTATVYANVPTTAITGNAVDLFCDARSQIAGSMNITACIVQCTNLLPDILPNSALTLKLLASNREAEKECNEPKPKSSFSCRGGAIAPPRASAASVFQSKRVSESIDASASHHRMAGFW